MKVLFVHNRYLQYGGEDNVVDAEISLLRANGLDVDIFAVKNPEGNISRVFYILFEFFNIISFIKVLRTIRQTKPDVIHVHNWHYVFSPSIFWAARLAKIDIYYTVHNYRLLCPSATLFFNGELFLSGARQKFPWVAVQNRVYQNSYIATFFLSFTLYFNQLINTWKIPKKFVFLNNFMADYFYDSKLQLRRDQVFVKQNFVDVSNYGPKISSYRNGFVFVGRLSEEKGIKLVLEVFSKLDQVISIIGDGPLKILVKEYAERHRNIKYFGFLEKEEILNHLSGAEALIFPSLWYEGMPITILESFSCGTPVFASNIGSLKSIVKSRENGLLFNPNDGNSLSLTMNEWRNMSLEMKLSVYSTTKMIFLNEYTSERNFQIFRQLYGIDEI